MMIPPIALISGAEGFIGSHLAGFLAKNGYQVRALVRYNSFQSIGWLNLLSPQEKQAVEVVFGDIQDAAQMRSLMKDVAEVYHLAALISIPYSYQAAQSFIDVNISGTLNLLEAAKEAQINRFLMVSTSDIR